MSTPLLIFTFACQQENALYKTSDSSYVDSQLDSSDSAEPPTEPAIEPEPLCSTHNIIIIPFNIWAQDLDVSWILDADLGWNDAEQWQNGKSIYLEDESQLLNVTLSSNDHRPLSLSINYDGSSSEDAVSIDAVTEGGFTTAHQWIDDCSTSIIFAGLSHNFFASSAPAPSYNKASLLMDGEEYWNAVADDLEFTESRISWSTWWWESDFELLRTLDPYMDEEERYQNTIMAFFREKTYIPKRILLNRFWGESYDWTSILYTDEELRDYAELPADFFEIILEGNNTVVPLSGELPDPNPEYSFTERVSSIPEFEDLNYIIRDDQQSRDFSLMAASWHQKSIILDGEIAYVSGFNTQQDDWDSRSHWIFDPRRSPFDADSDDRVDILEYRETPDLKPRADYGIRVEGPLVSEIEAVFSQRWANAIENELLYSENATFVEDIVRENEIEEGVLSQLNLTMPNSEVSIYESHKRAIESAEDYIFIEDQYFRAPILNSIIFDRMEEIPDLRLIVVTMAVSEYDPALKYTYESHSVFSENFPDRYLLLEERTNALILWTGLFWDDVEYYNIPIYNHSKVRMIDDRYLSVGSCNMNNRGYKYEGEMNISIFDDDFVRQARQTIFSDLVGPDYSPYLSDDPENNFEVLRLASEDNALVADWWNSNGVALSTEDAETEWALFRPSGFIYPLDFSSDYFDVAGPDLF